MLYQNILVCLSQPLGKYFENGDKMLDLFSHGLEWCSGRVSAGSRSVSLCSCARHLSYLLLSPKDGCHFGRNFGEFGVDKLFKVLNFSEIKHASFLNSFAKHQVMAQ
jgi:hypothetical protein